MNRYKESLTREIQKLFDIAKKARSLGYDPETHVEVKPAGDLASRVEGLVGPKGIGEVIKKLGRDNIPGIIDYILDSDNIKVKTLEERVEQALRTSLAIITEGVVAAPIEGISKVEINSNPDGSRYLSIYYAGPIRSAGGTAQGLSVVIGDYIRRKIGLAEYRPTKDEVERYVEEIKLYNDKAARLQYFPSEDDIREIVQRVNVCIDGEPTEDFEVGVHRDLERVKTNKVRGGVCLVIAEGIAQKAPKIVKYAEAWGMDWSWLSNVGKGKAKREKKIEGKITPIMDFMNEVVGGRPIFAAPSAKGGFRLRYGRTRATGIACKALHPATLVLLDNFIATGTQIKVERPGKGGIVTVCDSIEGPVVKLKSGSVLRVTSAEAAEKIKDEVEEILFLGDILISYGDFLQNNSPLCPAGFCEEWWIQEVKDALGEDFKIEDPKNLSAREAVELCLKYNVPLHPKYIYFWEDITLEQLETLVNWLLLGEIKDNSLLLELDSKFLKAKRVLELLCVPHHVIYHEKEKFVKIDEYEPFLLQLGMLSESRNRIVKDQILKEIESLKKIEDLEDIDAFKLVEKVSKVKIYRKVGTYIGARMGRPEKAKERKMQPPVHCLFPISEFGGKERLINLAAEKGTIPVEISKFYCSSCKSFTFLPRCSRCNNRTSLVKVCSKCGLVATQDKCPRCGMQMKFYSKEDIDLRRLWLSATAKVGSAKKVKGVKGMISKFKIPEPLEKGILRAKHDVYVFKDGTSRFDATDAPLTHFKPKEIGVSLEKLKELGYEKDYLGNPLENEDQIVELKIQDVIIPENAAKYLFRVSKFIDDLLERFYGLERYYNLDGPKDLVGHLIIGLAPHTSAGIFGRIIGFTKANVCFAHPFWHAAKRRNCDGDEDTIMLALDVLLNFSLKYLPEKRGGRMDAPLVVSTILDPKEVDDEAHKMEIITSFPREFYLKTLEGANPSEVNIKITKDILDNEVHSGFLFTHDTSDINGNILKSKYLTLKSMDEKVDAQLKVAEKIRAIDEREVAELIINSHFLRDTYGNLRAFSKQRFRCSNCNQSYRRVPLYGKCKKCGGKLLLTVTEGSITKYLDASIRIANKYNCSEYMKQRLELLRREIKNLFTNELSKQVGLAEFM